MRRRATSHDRTMPGLTHGGKAPRRRALEFLRIRVPPAGWRMLLWYFQICASLRQRIVHVRIGHRPSSKDARASFGYWYVQKSMMYLNMCVNRRFCLANRCHSLRGKMAVPHLIRVTILIGWRSWFSPISQSKWMSYRPDPPLLGTRPLIRVNTPSIKIMSHDPPR